MKRFVKRFGIIVFLTVIGFFVVGCEMEVDNDYELLNGIWDRGDMEIAFSNDTATFTEINSDSNWKTVQNNGYVRIGDKKFRNISKADDRKWTAQELVHDTSTYVTGWEDSTITISANGRTLYTTAQTAGSNTYTKK